MIECDGLIYTDKYHFDMSDFYDIQYWIDENDIKEVVDRLFDNGYAHDLFAALYYDNYSNWLLITRHVISKMTHEMSFCKDDMITCLRKLYKLENCKGLIKRLIILINQGENRNMCGKLDLLTDAILNHRDDIDHIKFLIGQKFRLDSPFCTTEYLICNDDQKLLDLLIANMIVCVDKTFFESLMKNNLSLYAHYALKFYELHENFLIKIVMGNTGWWQSKG